MDAKEKFMKARFQANFTSIHTATDSSEDERSEFELVWIEGCEMKYPNTSGGDASRGHTRSHPEHEG